MTSEQKQIYVMMGLLFVLFVVLGLVIGRIIPVTTETDLSMYAKRADLSPYAKKNETNETTDLSGYAKTVVLSDYVKKVDLLAFVADKELFDDDIVRQSDLRREVYERNAEYMLTTDLEIALSDIRATSASNDRELKVNIDDNYGLFFDGSTDTKNAFAAIAEIVAKNIQLDVQQALQISELYKDKNRSTIAI
jgi:hypothetical protein